MPKSLTASDRSALIRLASGLPKGSEERKAILAGLKGQMFEQYQRDWDLASALERPAEKSFPGQVWSIDTDVRGMGHDTAQRKWKQSRHILKISVKSPEASSFLQGLAAEHRLKVEPTFNGFALSSK